MLFFCEIYTASDQFKGFLGKLFNILGLINVKMDMKNFLWYLDIF
jgi:hypothetical protein